MAKKADKADTDEVNLDAADNEAAAQRRRVVRRRLLGSAVVFLMAFILWQMGTPADDVGGGDARVGGTAATVESAQSAADIAAAATEEALSGVGAVTESDGDTRVADTGGLPAAAEEESGVAVVAVTAGDETVAVVVEKVTETAADEIAEQIGEAAAVAAPETSESAESESGGGENESAAESETTKSENETAAESESGESESAAAEEEAPLTIESIAEAAGAQAGNQAPPPQYRFAVQVGAFSNQLSAAKTAQKIKGAGYDVKTEPVRRNGVDLLRVRVVGFDDRGAAEQARQAMVKLGFAKATIVNLL